MSPPLPVRVVVTQWMIGLMINTQQTMKKRLTSIGKVLVSCYVCMTEEHSLTHAGVDSFCDCTQWFVEKICSQISNRVETS